MKSDLSRFLLPFVVLSISFILLTKASIVRGAANHIVISQIQVGSGNNEFIELYNPTSNDVNLANWNITRKSASISGTGTKLIASGLTGIIHSHGYYLIANDSGSASPSADIVYGLSFSTNSTIQLFSDDKITLVDKVGFGTNVDPEASAAANPIDGGSVIRSLDDTGGNGQDTDNNSSDFTLLAVSNPRNSTVIITPTPTPTPPPTPTPTETPIPTPTPTETPIPTPTPTEIPTPTPTNIPTPSPTSTPIPTETPTPTPTLQPSPTPTMEPTAAPTVTPTAPTPTNFPTPTIIASPTLTPAPTQFPGFINFPKFQVACTTQFINFSIGFVQFRVPFPVCRLVAL